MRIVSLLEFLMANSKYEYVKSFEVEDDVLPLNLIIVRIDGRDFRRFSEAHEFEKPNDAKALNLMNSCALSLLEEYPDIVFSYGFSDEFSFVLKRTTKFYQRRARYCWEIAIFYSLNFVVLDCCMLLLRCRLVIRKHFHNFHFSKVRFDVSLVKGENSDLAAKYCPSLYLSSLLFIPQNGKDSFLRWS